MKEVIVATQCAIAIVAVTFTSCGGPKKIANNETDSIINDSIVTDNEGNQYHFKLFPDNNLWLTDNLKISMPGSYCYNDKKENCDRYGRLYTWQQANEGCSALGSGWRVATKMEWQNLAKLYSEKNADSITAGKNAFKAFMDPNTSGFNALKGGGRGKNGEYARIEAHGFYWTATSSGDSTAWMCNFGGLRIINYHNDIEKECAYSVRCVKNIAHTK